MDSECDFVDSKFGTFPRNLPKKKSTVVIDALSKIAMVLFALSLCSIAPAAGQEKAASVWEWLPDDRLMPRFLADPIDPAYSALKSAGTRSLDARIGRMWDILTWDGTGRVIGMDRVALGLGGAAWLLLEMRSHDKRNPARFPFIFGDQIGFLLMTADYYFGGYVVGERRFGSVTTRYRLHVIHISAHMGDDRYDPQSGQWEDGRAPIDYSRNYAQFTADAALPSGLRAYGSANYVFYQSSFGEHVARWFFSSGVELRRSGRPFGPFGAIDLRTFGNVRDVGTNVVLGVRVGDWTEKGLQAQVSRYRGPDWRGQFYGVPAPAEWLIGIELDL